MLGGVEIPHPRGLEGHSDADVLAHAIGDALLGALALGDLGQHFPPGDPRTKDISSLEILEHIAGLVRGRGAHITGVDATVVAEAPPLAPHLGEMRGRIARALGVAVGQVSVKATTHEGLGELGAGEAIAAHAIATVRQPASAEPD